MIPLATETGRGNRGYLWNRIADDFHSPLCWQLAGKLRNIIVFNGDTDPSVQMRGTEAAVSSFGLKATEEWRPWFYKPEKTSPAVLVEKLPYFGTFLSYKSVSGCPSYFYPLNALLPS